MLSLSFHNVVPAAATIHLSEPFKGLRNEARYVSCIQATQKDQLTGHGRLEEMGRFQ